MIGSQGDGAKLLNAVIDSLVVRVSRNKQPSDWMLELLAQVRDYRKALDDNPALEPLIIKHPDLGSFTLLSKVSGFYDFELVNPKIANVRIWNPDRWHKCVSNQTGQLYITFRSEFLQLGGVDAALEFIEALERVMCADDSLNGLSVLANQSLEFTRVSRVDLACDTQERRGMRWGDLDLYTCRARKRDAWKGLPLESLLQSIQRQATKKGQEMAAKQAARAVTPPRNNKGGDIGMAHTSKRGDGFVQHGSKPASDEVLNSALAPLVNSIASALDFEHESLIWYTEKLLKGVGFDPQLGKVSRVVANGSSDLQTVYFGRFASELYARRYDKLASLAVQGKEFMRGVWTANGWDGVSPVWRTEFSLSGDALSAWNVDGQVLDLRDIGLFLAAVPSVWEYLTADWLVHHQGGGAGQRCASEVEHDSIRKRPASALWRVVQSAFAGGQGFTRAKREPKPVLDQLKAQFDGLGVSMLAMMDSPRFRRSVDVDTGEIYSPLTKMLEDFAVMAGSDKGAARVAARQSQLGLDVMSDTALSALTRGEIMAAGRGS